MPAGCKHSRASAFSSRFAPRMLPPCLLALRARGIATADIGEFTADQRVVIGDGQANETIWDFARYAAYGLASARRLGVKPQRHASQSLHIPRTLAAAWCMRLSLAMPSAVLVSMRRFFAPDAAGMGFFRATKVRDGVRGGIAGRSRRALRWSRPAWPIMCATSSCAEHRRFDVWHAQDGISGNALATLKERGLISGFARTVHHVDTFADERVSRVATARDQSGRSSVRRRPAVARLAYSRTRS